MYALMPTCSQTVTEKLWRHNLLESTCIQDTGANNPVLRTYQEIKASLLRQPVVLKCCHALSQLQRCVSYCLVD